MFHIYEQWPGAIEAAWLDDGPAGLALRHLRALSPRLKGHLPRLVGRVVRSGGVLEWAVPRAKKLATETKAKINEAIVELREEISIAPWRSLTARRHGEHPS